MDIGATLTDSFTYAQEALVGKWTRWAIFILFALPFSLIQFLFDPKKIMTGTTINWGAISWGQIAVLAGLGIILSFFLSGYSVRIYRGVKTAPDFTGWTAFLSLPFHVAFPLLLGRGCVFVLEPEDAHTSSRGQ